MILLFGIYYNDLEVDFFTHKLCKLEIKPLRINIKHLSKIQAKQSEIYLLTK